MPIASDGRRRRCGTRAGWGGRLAVVACLLFPSTITSFAEGRSRRGSSTDANPASLSDSIMDLIKTEHVERILAEREKNTTRDRRLFLLQNALEDLRDSEEELYTKGRDQHRRSGRKHRNRGRRTDGKRHDFFTPDYIANLYDGYNLTRVINGHESLDPSLVKLLTGDRGKILKSSKNALVVTRKEYLKKDWCKTETLIQKIREEGCQTRTIVNRFCYGQCNSFYIPKNSRQRLETSAFKSCAFCKPKKVSWVTVTLICPGSKPEIRKKRVQRIKQCKCITEVLN